MTDDEHCGIILAEKANRPRQTGLALQTFCGECFLPLVEFLWPFVISLSLTSKKEKLRSTRMALQTNVAGSSPVISLGESSSMAEQLS